MNVKTQDRAVFSSGTWPSVPILMDPDPLQHRSGPNTAWTVTNAAEAMPGVLSPLGASFWIPTCELGLRSAFHDLGVLAARDVTLPDVVDERLSGVFSGRYAANLDSLRRMADLTPGTSGDAMERQLFGEAREGMEATPGLRRVPFVLAKGPVSVATLPRRLRRATRELHDWWRAGVTRDLSGNPDVARDAFVEAMRGTAYALRTHMATAMVGQGLFDQVRALAGAAGKEGLELRLITGFGDLEESRLVAQLHNVATGKVSLELLLEEYGFHGPEAGEISSRSWREDAAPLQRLLGTYAGSDRSRGGNEGRLQALEAEAELLGALPPLKRAPARLVLKIARNYNPLREVSKANFLKGVDVARHAARAIGRQLASDGKIEDPEHVFMLTTLELLESFPSDPRQVVSERLEQRGKLLGFELPDRWVGQAQPLRRGSNGLGDRTSITGIPAATGSVEGRARVVVSATQADVLDEGEVLVCEITDPSWSAVLGVVSGLVIDIGGPMSHGAIIAREFGIPCVIGTRDGTTVIHTGDLIRVDGDRGSVEIVQRASPTFAPEADPELVVPVVDATVEFDGSDFPVLRALALKGTADAASVAIAAGISDGAERFLERFIASGLATLSGRRYRITEAGRQRTSDLLEVERAKANPSVIAAFYDKFCGLNDLLKALVHDWQLVDGGTVNDHQDADYDAVVVERLLKLHVEVRPLVAELADEVSRMMVYSRRLDHAVTHLEAGNHDWLAKPTVDSYHSVWFELHEELIALLGRTRISEAKAGRAE